MELEKILIQRSNNAKVFPLPKPKKEGDVGFDLYASEDTYIPPRNQIPIDVPTGCKVKIPEGYWMAIVPRSGALSKGILIPYSVIDNGFTGELLARCFNMTDVEVTIQAGVRLAQFVIFPIFTPGIQEVNELPKTERGESGFGSTDK